MASCLLKSECVNLERKLYKMTWWATALNQIVVPSGMNMCGGSLAVITNTNGVESYHYNASTGAWKKDPVIEGGGGGDTSELENRISAVEESVGSIQEYVDDTSSDVEALIQSKPDYDSVVTNLGTALNTQYVSVPANSNKTITCPASIRSLVVVNGVASTMPNIFIVTRLSSSTVRITKVLGNADVAMSASAEAITITNNSSSYTAHVSFINFINKFTI